MATLSLSSLSSLTSLSAPKSEIFVHLPSSLQWRTTCLRIDGVSSSSAKRWIATEKPTKVSRGPRRLRSSEEETLAPEQQGEPEVNGEAEQQSVSVPVSPSDTLTMLFQADGIMSESAIPGVTRALEEVEGVSNLKVQVVEGIASVELEKQTTVQATGVASGLVESLQGLGFKLQTLQLSFDDQETDVA